MKVKYSYLILIITSIIILVVGLVFVMSIPLFIRDSVDGSTTITKKITEDYYYTSNSNGILKGDENGGVVVYEDGVDSIGSNNNFILVFSKEKYTLIRLSDRKVDSIPSEIRFKDFKSVKLVDLSSFLETTK